MLSGFFETREQIDLNVDIFRGLGKLDLIPSLGCRPPPSFAVVERLLIECNILEERRYAVKTVWIIDLGVNLLQRLQNWIAPLLFMCLLLSVPKMWLQEEERPSVFVTIDGPLRD